MAVEFCGLLIIHTLRKFYSSPFENFSSGLIRDRRIFRQFSTGFDNLKNISDHLIVGKLLVTVLSN